MNVQEAKELFARSVPVPKWLRWIIGGLITYALATTFCLLILRVQIDNLHSRLIALEFCDMQYNAAEIIEIQENFDWHRGMFKLMAGIQNTKEEKAVLRKRIGLFAEPRKR